MDELSHIKKAQILYRSAEGKLLDEQKVLMLACIAQSLMAIAEQLGAEHG